MKKKIGLFLVAFMVLTSLVYAQPARSIVDSNYDALDVNPDGSIDIGTITSVEGTISVSGLVVRNDTLTGGYRDVASAGTPITVSGSVVVNRVIIKASLTNTGNIYVGGTDVGATAGFPLDAGEVWIGTVDNLDDIWIDATVDGDSVGFTYEH